jgi:hypothetical protein
MAQTDAVQSWDVVISGVPYQVTLHDGESGKLAVRANGRVVTRPIAPEERECIFSLAGATCTLSRERDGSFSLVVKQPLPDATGGPGSKIGVSFLTPRLLLWIFVLLLFVLPVFWVLNRSSYENVAKRRVEQVLAGMSGPMDSVPIALWARDVRSLADNNELSWASDNFDRWRAQKDIGETLKSWKVVEVEEIEDADPPTAIVKVEINGRPLSMKVPERMPISWAD